MEATKKLDRSKPSSQGKIKTCLRVVIVDDSCAFLEALEDFLVDDPRVRVVGRAVSAGEAEERIRFWKPDLMLLDLCLPDRSGLEAARTLKRGSNPPHVVIMSINESPEYPTAARAAGADGFLSKSDIAAELPAVIDRLCFEQGIGREQNNADRATEPRGQA